MPITSTVQILNQFTGDLVSNILAVAAANTASPAENVPTRLVIGNNTISPPVTTGVTVTGLTIIPPAGNVNLITLKGIGADTGIPIHKTNPTFIPFDSSFTSLVLSVTVQTDNVRLVWS